jgi:DNA-binding transcriptional ArsR family regulator
MREDLDRIWKALADDTRRSILDFLRNGPRTTTEIVERFSDLTRFGVMKHLDVLRQAGLVLTHEDGRRRFNSLNAAPIRLIYERWVSRYEGYWAHTLVRIKEDAEKAAKTSARPCVPRMRVRQKTKPRRQARAAVAKS